MSSSPDAFRAVMRRWPSGVTVITVPSPEGPHGMTASAFTSVSIDPPLILVVVDARWRSHALIHEAGVFCVNLLAEDQSEWSDRFAGRRPELDDRFEGLALSRAETGAPCLDDARGWLDCRLEAAHAAGDHTIFVGRVLATHVSARPTGPLVYHDGAYGRLDDEAPR
ncbi:MAG: flavin reductase [Caldilineae bacterium]|nr:flavin reductase [Chloroflexota bacterium]MCB9175611.1 flavin reductase [Caldilineae bacterium]